MKLSDLKAQGVIAKTKEDELTEREIKYVGVDVETGKPKEYSGSVSIVKSRWSHSKQVAALVEAGHDHATALIHVYARFDGGKEQMPVDVIASLSTPFVNALVGVIGDVVRTPDLGKP